MASYIAKSLLPDEQILYIGTLHWVIFLQGLGFVMFGGILGALSFQLLTFLFGPQMAHDFTKAVDIAAFAVILIGVFLLLGAYVRQTATELAVTNRRLIAKYGFISRSTYEILTSRITGANFDQTITGRLLGYGTIYVHGAGGEISPFDNIDQPNLFYKALVTAQGQARG